jgi:DNA-binding NarL/FixJ family response regulator
VVFTSSMASHDIERSYRLGANSYVSKPGILADYVATVKSIEEFWVGVASIPLKEELWKITTPTSC